MTIKYKHRDLKKRLKKRLIEPKEATSLIKYYKSLDPDKTPSEKRYRNVKYYSDKRERSKAVKTSKMTIKIKVIREGKIVSSTDKNLLYGDKNKR